MRKEMLNLLEKILDEQKEQTKILQSIEIRLEGGVPTRKYKKHYTFEELKGGGSFHVNESTGNHSMKIPHPKF